MRRLVAAALVLGFASTATAQPESAYYGLSLGSFDYSEESAPPFFTGIDDSASSWKLMIGYQFMEHLMVEGALGKTSVISDRATISDPFLNPTPFTVDYNTEFQSFIVRLLGVMNFDSGLTVLGGIGWAEMNQDIDVVDNGPGIFGASGDQDIGEPTYIAGVQYDADRFAIRLAYEKYDFDSPFFTEGDIEETSVTFFYKL